MRLHTLVRHERARARLRVLVDVHVRVGMWVVGVWVEGVWVCVCVRAVRVWCVCACVCACFLPPTTPIAMEPASARGLIPEVATRVNGVMTFSFKRRMKDGMTREKVTIHHTSWQQVP
jgi:hypothetical protein